MELREPLHALSIVSGCHGEGRSLHPRRQTDGHQSVPCASDSRTVGKVPDPVQEIGESLTGHAQTLPLPHRGLLEALSSHVRRMGVQESGRADVSPRALRQHLLSLQVQGREKGVN